jgi:hypothetical protein
MNNTYQQFLNGTNNINFNSKDSPLYDKFNYHTLVNLKDGLEKDEKMLAYKKDLMRIVREVVFDIGYDLRQQQPLMNFLMYAVVNQRIRSVPVHMEEMWDQAIKYMLEVYEYDGEHFIKKLPVQHDIEFVNDKSIKDKVDIELCNAMISLPVTYTEETVLTRFTSEQQEASLYLFEHRMLPYYVNNNFFVTRQFVINRSYMSVLKIENLISKMSMPFVFFYIRERVYLEYETYKNLRLVSKSFHNGFTPCVKLCVTSQQAFDVFFSWFRRYYYRGMKDMRASDDVDNVRLWRLTYRTLYDNMKVSTKYARYKTPASRFHLDSGIDGHMTCVQHHRYRCTECDNSISQSQLVSNIFNNYSFNNREFLAFLEKFLLRKKITRSRIKKLFTDFIGMMCEPMVVNYFYKWLKKRKVRMTTREHKIFTKYAQGWVYAHLSIKSHFGISRVTDMPIWPHLALSERKYVIDRPPDRDYDVRFSPKFYHNGDVCEYDFFTHQITRVAVEDDEARFFQDYKDHLSEIEEGTSDFMSVQQQIDLEMSDINIVNEYNVNAQRDIQLLILANNAIGALIDQQNE